jgi:hypothetical protein
MEYTGYKNSKYYDPDAGVQTVRSWINPKGMEVPKLNTPITPKENFRRSIGFDNPLWMPISTMDMQSVMANDVMGNKVRGMQIHSDLGVGGNTDKEYRFRDWFNTDWTWVPMAGGAMLTPGTQLLEDITDWEKVVEWPTLSEWGFEEKAASYLRDVHDPNKALTYDMGRGVTERLVSVMGGYTDSMMALSVEPEACRAFFERCADFSIETFDYINSLYPLDMVCLHDDWGTEKDTFFSEKMMEELVFEPTKRIVDHIKSKGVFFELHTCGNVNRFMPYIVALGTDVAQLQRRVVDLPAWKAKFGGKLGYSAGIEGVDFGAQVSEEEYLACVRRTADIYAPGGKSYAGLFSANPDTLRAGILEMYCYSREYYDAN